MAPQSPPSRAPRRALARPIVAPSLAERAAAVAGGSAPATGPALRPRPRARALAPALESPSIPTASVFLGIDPGTRVVGWGVIALTSAGPRMIAAGVVRTGSDALPQRLGLIRRELDRLIAQHRPSAVVVEEAFAHKNMQSALRIGEARGVVLSCAAAVGIAVYQYPPAAAKKALVGNGGAHKSQVAAMVARQLKLSSVPRPLDASDALALALTHMLRGPSRR